MNETLNAGSLESHPLGRRLLLICGAIGMFLLLGNLGSQARAGSAVRSCNPITCAEYLYFDADPGEVNVLRTALGQAFGEGRYYWIGDENNVIHLGEAEGYIHGNGCEHPGPDDRSEFPNLPRSHVVRCRWGSDGSVSFRLGDRNDVALGVGPNGRSIVNGGAGQDTISAGWIVEGGPGDDELSGETGHQILRGGDGRDVLSGEYGPDDLRGGDGFDTVSYSGGGSVRVTIGDGRSNDGGRCDEYDLTAGGCDGHNFGRSDEVFGDIEKVIGGRGNDTLFGDDGPNELEGRGGDDRIRGAGGNDILRGGGSIPTDDGTVVFGGFNDIDGGEGDDLLLGGIEGDNLLGGPGNDDLRGDQSVIYEGTDFLNGGGGNDLLNGGARPYLEDGTSSMDLISGGTGFDTVDYSSRTEDLVITLDGVNNDGAAGGGKAGEQDGVSTDVENVLGGDGNDFLWGSPNENRLDGSGGNDVLIGDMGADDFYGGEGSDTVSYADRSKGVRATIDDYPDDGEVFLVDDRETTEGDNVRLDIEILVGGAGNDELFGGKSPAATIFGGLGDDLIGGGPGPDHLDGEGGDDTIYALDGVKEDVIGGDGQDSADVDDFDSVTGVENLI